MYVGKRPLLGLRTKQRLVPAVVMAVCLFALTLLPSADAANTSASGLSMKITLFDDDVMVVTVHGLVPASSLSLSISGDESATTTGTAGSDGRYFQGVYLPSANWSGALNITVTSGAAKIVKHVVIKNGKATVSDPATTTTTTTAKPTTTTSIVTTTTTEFEEPEPTTAAPSTSTTVAKTTVPSTTSSGNPLAGVTFTGINKNAAAQAAAWKTSQPENAALMTKMANVPTAQWGNSTEILASSGNKVPVLVVYNIPGRDCGQYSSGGAGGEAEYNAFIDKYAAGIGKKKAVVILEPDAISQMCGDAAARYRMLNHAVDALAKTGAITYIDAGNPGWVDAKTTADRLKQAGVAKVRGFAINTSNFKTDADNKAYGDAIAKELNSHYVVDTSRNGNGPGNDWCNPDGRALGKLPTTNTGSAYADAFLWIKVPGESDGNCNGGPGAGQWFPSYALGLAQRAKWQ